MYSPSDRGLGIFGSDSLSGFARPCGKSGASLKDLSFLTDGLAAGGGGAASGMSRPTKQLSTQWGGSGRGRGVAMDTPAGGPFLNPGALVSPVGVARLCQLALGGALVSLVVHYTGHSGAPYGWLCMAVWSYCLAVTAAIALLDVTRLHVCLPFSWGDLTAAHAALAALLHAAAAALYPVYFLLPGCSWGTCGTWRYRVALSVCACACCLAYAAEPAALRWACRRRRPQPLPYMATPPGLLKVGQACVAGVIFGALANGEYSRHAPAKYCVAVYAVCFVATTAVIALAVCGRIGAAAAGSPRSAAAASPASRFPADRAVAVYALLAALLYLSAAVVWPVYLFHASYGGAPDRPRGCPRWGGRGRCPWDAHLVVAVFTGLNLLLYLADLAYSHRRRPVSQQPLFV